jgi:Protein CHAPERONE-LIKE PROTEIN OF POR1-like
MSEQNPYQQLGVTENASFEEIQVAKQRLLAENQGNERIIEAIEAAYDATIMDRLRMRQEGKIKVPEGIRFPEKSYEVPKSSIAKTNPPNPSWLQQFFDRPTKEDLVQSSIVYLVLAGITAFPESGRGSLLSLLLALGFSGTVYFLNRKEGRTGRAVAIALLSLFIGVLLGTALVGLLPLQNLHLGINISQISTIFAFIVFWLVSNFIR